MYKASLLTILFFISFLVSSQSKVWVTVNKKETIVSLQQNVNVLNLKKALPNSRSQKLQNVYEVTTNDLISFLRQVRNNKDITHPQIVEEFETLYEPNDFTLSCSNDYALDLINAKEAWDITQGSPYINIGIFEPGYDINHEELIGKYTYLYPYSNLSNSVHGTAVAITAAGNTDNSLGKSSVGFKSSLSLHGMNYNELLAATYSGVQVINISWSSGCNYNSYYQSVIEEVYQNGTVIIAAAGNGSTCGGASEFVYPASFEHVISVSSINIDDKHQPIDGDPSSTHQHNDSVDLVAPGYNIALSLPNNQYVSGSGTSFSAPIVSGTVALMLSVNNCLTPDQIEQILKDSSEDIYSVNPEYIGKLGAGRLNAALAVQMAKDSNPIDYTIHKFNSTCDEIEALFVTLNSGSISDHTIQWSDGNHDWSRYNLSDDNYEIMITNSEGCMAHDTVSYTLVGPEFDYKNSVIINSENDVLEDLNGDGLIKVKGSIVIENGVKYTISDKTVEFSNNNDLSNDPNLPSSGIVVKPLANFTLNRTILRPENSCISTFGGIEVISNDVSQHGSLTVLDSRIEDAQVGVCNIPKKKINSEHAGGGKVVIENSSFSNNLKAVHLVGSKRSKTTPVISNSNFKVENMVSNVEQLYIENQNIIFQYNQLSGNENMLASMRGAGIVLKNASLSTPNVKPLLGESLNSIQHFKTGLLIDSCLNSRLIIDNYLFDSNLIGVSIVNSENITLKNSEIHIPDGTFQLNSIGLVQMGASQSEVISNLFEGHGNSAFNIAIKIIDQNEDKGNVIHSNQISGELTEGVLFVGENQLELFSCNDFTVQGNNDLSILNSEAGTASLQFSNTTLLNKFSDNTSVNYNIINNSEQYVFEYTDVQDFLPNQYMGYIDVNELEVVLERDNVCNSISSNFIESSELQEDHNSLGFLDQQESKNMIYPNPNNGKFLIHLDDQIEEVNIYSMNGGLVKSYKEHQITNNYQVNVNNGIYNVLISLKNGDILSRKMIVNN